MNKLQFLEVLNFPSVWKENELLPDAYFLGALEAYKKEYGEDVPDRGAEHWRFGAFMYLIRNGYPPETLPLLIEAALKDTDYPMAGGVLHELLASPFATESDLQRVYAVIESSKYYYKSAEQLKSSFKAGKGPYATKP